MKPLYYDKFYCIADKCDFTCCQEWKITVDDATYKKWNTEKIEVNTKIVDGARIITLDKCGKCPRLNEKGLCDIVLTKGEDYISDTCHIFPREEHIYGRYKEQSLVFCCPYVIDLINAEKEFALVTSEDMELTLEEMLEENKTDIVGMDPDAKQLFDMRNDIIDFFANENYTLSQKFEISFYVMLACIEKGEYDSKIWSIAAKLKTSIENMPHNYIDSLYECNELLLDVIDNYVKEGLYKRFLDGFYEKAVNFEKLLDDDDEESLNEQRLLYNEFIEKWNENDALITKIFCAEIFGEILNDESDFESMAVKFQWLSIEYIVLRHFCFLHYKDKGMPSYEELRNIIVLTFRMMGYDDEDIVEYLNNSFEKLVWDWGYLALLFT